jgi:hypothetical protein
MDKQIKRFLLVGSQRSGTTIMQKVLMSHPEINMMHGEGNPKSIFISGIQFFSRGGVKENKLTKFEIANGYREIFDLLCNIGGIVKPVGGVKIACSNINDARYICDGLRNNFQDISVIHIQRENLVDQFASFLRASRLNEWHSTGRDTQKSSMFPIKVSKYAYLWYLDTNLRLNNMLSILHLS